MYFFQRPRYLFLLDVRLHANLDMLLHDGLRPRNKSYPGRDSGPSVLVIEIFVCMSEVFRCLSHQSQNVVSWELARPD